MHIPSNTVGGAKERLNGNACALVGDWAKKYERMGEPEGEGMPACCELVDEDIGVGMSKAELEPDEADDTDADRPRPKREAMGIGSE